MYIYICIDIANIPLPIKCEKSFDMNLGSFAHNVWWLWGDCVVQLLRKTLLTNRTKWFISVSVLILRLRCYWYTMLPNMTLCLSSHKIRKVKLNLYSIYKITLRQYTNNLFYLLFGIFNRLPNNNVHNMVWETNRTQGAVISVLSYWIKYGRGKAIRHSKTCYLMQEIFYQQTV